MRGNLDFGVAYENPGYAGKLFVDRPLLANVIDSVSCANPGSDFYWQGPNLTDDPNAGNGMLKYFSYNSAPGAGFIHNRVALIPYANGNGADPTDVFFTGVNVATYIAVALAGPPAQNIWQYGPEISGVLYRRLGRQGINLFHVRSSAMAVDFLSMYFIVAPDPGNAAGFTALMGNLGTAALPWNYMGTTVPGPTDGSRRSMTYNRLHKISVPDNGVIFFCAMPADSTGAVSNNTVYNLEIQITPFNVGTFGL